MLERNLEHSLCVGVCVLCFSSLEDSFFCGKKTPCFLHDVKKTQPWQLQDGDSHVGPQEFIDGCLRLKGPARSIDVQH